MAGIEGALLQHMVREIKGWSCGVCGHHSTSTAAKSDIKKHVWNRHVRDKFVHGEHQPLADGAPAVHWAPAINWMSPM